MLHYSSKKIEFSRLDPYRNFGFGRRLRLCLQVLKILQTIYCMIGTVTHLHVPSRSQRKVLFYHHISLYLFIIFTYLLLNFFKKINFPSCAWKDKLFLTKKIPKNVFLFIFNSAPPRNHWINLLDFQWSYVWYLENKYFFIMFYSDLSCPYFIHYGPSQSFKVNHRDLNKYA